MKTAMQIAVESYKNDGVSFTDWFLDNYEMLLEKEKKQMKFAFNFGRDMMLRFKVDDEAEYFYKEFLTK